ncbi:MAG: YnbE family lipoprotein [Parvularculaceae bacterium]
MIDKTLHLAVAAGLASAAGCATVKVEPPDKPIEINLNVNVSGEVRVRLEKEIEDLIEENPDIF